MSALLNAVDKDKSEDKCLAKQMQATAEELGKVVHKEIESARGKIANLAGASRGCDHPSQSQPQDGQRLPHLKAISREEIALPSSVI